MPAAVTMDYGKVISAIAGLTTIGLNSRKIFAELFGPHDDPQQSFRQTLTEDLAAIEKQIAALTYYPTWKSAWDAVTGCGAFIDVDVRQTLATLVFTGRAEDLGRDDGAAREPKCWTVTCKVDNHDYAFNEWIERFQVLDRIYLELAGNEGASVPDGHLLRNACDAGDGIGYCNIFDLYLAMVRALRGTAGGSAVLARTDYDLVLRLALTVHGLVVSLARHYEILRAIYRYLGGSNVYNDLDDVLADFDVAGKVWSGATRVMDGLTAGLNDGLNAWSGSRLGWDESNRKGGGDINFVNAVVEAPAGCFLSAVQLVHTTPTVSETEYVDSGMAGRGANVERTVYVDNVALQVRAARLAKGFAFAPVLGSGGDPQDFAAPTGAATFGKHWVNVAASLAPEPPDANHVPVITALRFNSYSNRVALEARGRFLRIEPNGSGTLVGDDTWWGQGATPAGTLRLDDGDCSGISQTYVGAEKGLFPSAGGILSNLMLTRYETGGSTRAAPLTLYVQSTPTIHKTDYLDPRKAAGYAVLREQRRWSDLGAIDGDLRVLLGLIGQTDPDVAARPADQDLRAQALNWLNRVTCDPVDQPSPPPVGAFRPGDLWRDDDDPGVGKPVDEAMTPDQLADLVRQVLTLRDAMCVDADTLKGLDANGVASCFNQAFSDAVDAINAAAGGAGREGKLDQAVFKTVADKARLLLLVAT